MFITSKHLFNAHCVPGPLEGTGDAKANGPTFKEVHFRGRAEKQFLAHGHRGQSMEKGFEESTKGYGGDLPGGNKKRSNSGRENVMGKKEAASESQSF